MARGFGSGVAWGLGLAILAFGTWSELAPPPSTGSKPQVLDDGAEAEALADKTEGTEVADAGAEVSEAKPENVADVEEPKSEEAVTAGDTDAGAADALAEPAAPAVSPEEPAAPEGQGAGEGEAAKSPEQDEDQPSLTGLDQALTAPEAEEAPAPVADSPEGTSDVLLQPVAPGSLTEPEQLPQLAPMPENEAAPADSGQLPPPADGQAPVPDQAPEPGIEGPVQQEPPALPDAGELEDKVPTNVMDKQVPGVKQGGLPQIGQEAAPSDVEGKAEVNDLPPVQQFARAFQPEGKPLFAILLQDVGAAGMTRAELAKLPFPVSVVIDPLSPDASQAMADWRAAGQEVVMLGNGLPVGATAGDVETTFAALGKVLPEAVAVLDPDLGGFQDNRPLATLVLPVIGGQGRGLITWDRGLNAADQIAQRENVPAAVIFRKLDGEGESKEVMRRYLDRAAFKAAQEGAVVVIGDTRPETVATILEWAVEGRSGTVSLAPITAVMSR